MHDWQDVARQFDDRLYDAEIAFANKVCFKQMKLRPESKVIVCAWVNNCSKSAIKTLEQRPSTVSLLLILLLIVGTANPTPLLPPTQKRGLKFP